MALALIGCSDDPTGPSNTGSVTVDDFEFDPSSITVAAGGTVTWTWNGTTSETHNVNFASASITDSALQTSGTHTVTMPTTPGTYLYQCDHHPVEMTGAITVQ
jgi:plastocyanin